MNALLFFSVSLVHLISLRPGEACGKDKYFNIFNSSSNISQSDISNKNLIIDTSISIILALTL